jgi:hypothetical protein
MGYYYPSEYHPPKVWCIIVIVLYAIAALLELFRFWQTRSKLHLFLFLPAALVVAAYVLELSENDGTLIMVEEGLFLFAIANWMTLIISVLLLSIWVHSMFGHLQTQYSRHLFRFVQVCLVLFTLTALDKCILYFPYIDATENYHFRCKRSERKYCIWDVLEYYEMLIIPSAIETAIICILESFCTGILLKFQNVVDPELMLKRRQLTWITIIFFTQFVYSACSVTSVVESLKANLAALRLFADTIQAYISISALFIYFVLTLVPRNAITGFNKVPDLPAIVHDKSTIVPGQPIIAPSLPAVVPDQPTVVMDQPTFVSYQSTVMPYPPTATTGRFTLMTDQLTIMSGQPTLVTGQLNFVTDQLTVVPGQPL